MIVDKQFSFTFSGVQSFCLGWKVIISDGFFLKAVYSASTIKRFVN